MQQQASIYHEAQMRVFIELKPDKLRDVWYRSSYLLDRKQSGENIPWRDS
jgi:hypothetical protein